MKRKALNDPCKGALAVTTGFSESVSALFAADSPSREERTALNWKMRRGN